MSTFKKLMSLVLVVALTASIAIAGTVAYLQDDDSDVNVMTLGSVYIEQIEQERDANGALVDFTQAKPAYPAVGAIDWDDTKLDVNGTGYKVFDDGLKNVVDKIVTVKNIGKSDAYVRTIVAIEAPDGDPDNLIHVNINGDLSNTSWKLVKINGVDYVYSVFTYAEALKPGEISTPSLMQVFLDSKTENEDVAKFGDTWDILVLSQAVQTAGFEGVTTFAARATVDDVAAAHNALETAFPGAAVPDVVAGWFGGITIPRCVSNAEEFIALLDDVRVRAKQIIPGTEGDKSYRETVNIILTDDIVIDGDTEFMYTDGNGAPFHFYGVEGTIDLNGHDIIVSEDALLDGKTCANAVLLIQYSNVDIVGDGSIIAKNQSIPVYGWANGTVNIYGGNYVTNAYERSESAVYVNNPSMVINVYGGKYENSEYAFNAHDKNCGNTPVIVLHEGVEFEEFLKNGTTDVITSDLNAGRIQLAEGCELQGVTIDGETWHQVVKK